MIREPKTRKDGFNALFGVDSSVKPVLLQDTQAAFAGNVVFRGGFPSSRPGFVQLPFSFPTDEVASWFEANILQGGIIYQPKSGNPLAVASIGGRIFAVDILNDFTVSEITPIVTTTCNAFTCPAVGSQVAIYGMDCSVAEVGHPLYVNGEEYLITKKVSNSTLQVENVSGTPGAIASGSIVNILNANARNLGRAWFVQAEFFLLVQDGQSRCMIFDGSKSFRSDPTLQQVPTGTAMAYGKGRLWVAVNKNEFMAGDIVRGSSGTIAYERWDAILYFKENSYIAGGGAFSVPYQAGEITAMQFTPVLDTSTGQGPMIVFTDNGAFSVDAPVDRTSWATVSSPIQSVVLSNGGALSFYGTITTTNSDIFFRNREGLKSFYQAIREFSNSWGTTPVSSEMTVVLQSENQSLLPYSSAIQFDNRLWFTVQPQRWPDMDAGAYHRGLGSLDFHNISNMRSKSPPAYDGMHSGIRPTLLVQGIFNGVERAFCWSLNAGNVNELWEITRSNPFDNDDGRITSFVESKGFVKGNPFEMMRLNSAELYVDDVKGSVDFTIYYKPDQYPCWIEWGRGQTVCTGWRDCMTDNDDCSTPVTRRPGYKTRLAFGQPSDEDNEADGKPSRLGYEFQFRVEWAGHCRIRKFLASFQEVTEEVFPTVS